MSGMTNAEFFNLKGEGDLILWTLPERLQEEIIKLVDRVVGSSRSVDR